MADGPVIQIDKPIVLLGMMGAGKSSLGVRLGEALGLKFRDADTEIEKAAQMSIPEIFENHGETAFREGERRVILRLLTEGPQVLALGGGAFVNDETREQILAQAHSIWLDVPLDELVRRAQTQPLAGRTKRARQIKRAARGPRAAVCQGRFKGRCRRRHA